MVPRMLKGIDSIYSGDKSVGSSFLAIHVFEFKQHQFCANDYTIAIAVIFQSNPFARKSNRYVVEVDILIMFVLEPVAPG